MSKPPVLEPRRARPQFTVRTILWLTAFVAIFAGCGLALELLMGMAWLALAPAVIVLLAVLQYPLMRRATRMVEREEDLQDHPKSSS